MSRGRPTLVIDGTPELPFFYALPDVPGGRWSWEEHPRHNIEAFARAGFRLFQLDFFLDHCWRRTGEIDLDLLKRQISGVIEVVPDASVMLRLHVNAPMWWIEAHPEEWVGYDGTVPEPEHAVGLTRILEADPRNARRFSLASIRWKEEATAVVTELLRRFADEPEGRSLVAVQPASGVYGEWHYWGFLRWEPDDSEAMTTHFRSWLLRRYRTDESLTSAWGDPDATISRALVPDAQERSSRDSSSGIFRDPARCRRVVDYYRCQQELVADLVIHFCHTVKSAWPAPIAAGAFYGYYFSLFNRHAAGGHLELERVLDSPDVDFLCGPQVYYPDDQEPGRPYRSRGLLASVLLHRKLWLDEYDQEPVRTFPFLGGLTDNRASHREKVQLNRSCIRRSSLFAFQKGMGIWFYDFGPSGMHINRKGEYNGQLGTAGYWDHPVYMDDVEAIRSIAASALDRPYRSSADVLVVYDPHSHYYLPSTVADPDPISPRVIDWLTLGLYDSGVVFDSIALFDLGRVDLASYRLVVLANAYLLGEEAAGELWCRAATSESDLLWIHAPGILAGERFDPARVSRIVRLELAPHHVSGIPAFSLGVDRCAMPGDASEVARTVSQPIDRACEPLFRPVDADGEIWGWYDADCAPGKAPTDSRSGATCLTRYRRDGVRAWYSGLPPYEPSTLRAICAESGVHRYSESGDIVYAGSGFLTVHSAEGGVRRITLRSGTPIDVDFGTGPGTCVLDESTGEVILGVAADDRRISR